MGKPKQQGPSGVAQRILAVLEKNPEGLDIDQIRKLGGIEGHQHLDRRLRSLDPFYKIDRIRDGKRIVYRLVGAQPEGAYEYETISKTVRAKILTRDGRRCRMCGKTVDADGVKLHIDHKIPQNWGGSSEPENLWALCSACNEGKRNYFTSFDAETMESVLGHESVHRRIAELLRLKLGEWVDCDLLEFVANFEDYQTDWRKRLRELRYLGLKIESKNSKIGKRTLSNYRLNDWVELPDDLSAATRNFENQRAKRNRKTK